MSRQILARVFSGIQPTGNLHLGNYFGAVKRWVQSLEDDKMEPHQRLFSVVDLHAITLPQDPKELRRNILNMTSLLLSCGLDPEKCILFQQSMVKEHAELAWILGCHCTVPQLGKLKQYKEKSAQLKEVPLGLYVYPVLQAADILLYKSTQVPVGEDNVQNVQVAHQLVRAFNNRYGDFFPRPELLVVKNDQTSRVKSLRNPEKKMSKSDPDQKSCIYISDSPDSVLEKCKKAVTDFIGQVTFDPEKRPGVSNLLSIHSACTGQSIDVICKEVEHLNSGQYKIYLSDVLNEHLKPIREKHKHYENDLNEVEKILERGSEKARTIAEETMSEVRKLIGLR